MSSWTEPSGKGFLDTVRDSGFRVQGSRFQEEAASDT